MKIDFGSFHFEGTITEVITGFGTIATAFGLWLAPSPVMGIMKTKQKTDGENNMSETKGLDAVTALVVDLAKGIRGAFANGSNIALDLALLLPIIQDVPAAFANSGLIVAEIEGLDPAGLAQVEADALAILAAAMGGTMSPKITIDVQEGIKILTSLYKIFKA